MGSMLIYYGKQLNNIEDTPVDFIRQITTDWTATPYVGIQVTTNTYCPDGYESIYSRPWYGIAAACDCLHWCSYDDDGNEADFCY